MSLAANAVQKAVFQRLTTQLSPVPVFDHVPQDQPFPYVVIGEDTSLPWDTKGGDGQEFTCTIHAWDTLRAGRKSVKAIMEGIYRALHHKEEHLAVEGHYLAEMRCEFGDSFQEAAEGSPDRNYHGVLRFRALIHDN